MGACAIGHPSLLCPFLAGACRPCHRVRGTMMTIIAQSQVHDQIGVAAGVDTQGDIDSAAVIDCAGRLLGHQQFPC
jgi:hypothetical protein